MPEWINNMKRYLYKGTTADIQLDLEPEFFNECLYFGMRGEDDRGAPVDLGQWLPYEEIPKLIKLLDQYQGLMKKHYSKKKSKK